MSATGLLPISYAATEGADLGHVLAMAANTARLAHLVAIGVAHADIAEERDEEILREVLDASDQFAEHAEELYRLGRRPRKRRAKAPATPAAEPLTSGVVPLRRPGDAS